MTTLAKTATIDWQAPNSPDIGPDTSIADRDARLPRLVPGEVEVRHV